MLQWVISYLLNGMFASFDGDVHVKHLHALFHIRTVFIPRDRYRSEGFFPEGRYRSRDDNSPNKEKGMH